jgi:HPt (histidine-containing phosphotransfer) domain-containing protein
VKTDQFSGPSMDDAIAFDLDGTLKRLGGDRELLAELIQLFAEDAPLWLNRTAAGIADGKPENVRHAAHAFRGLAANFGAERLKSTLFQLEEKASSGILDGAPALLDDARRETDELQHVLAPHRTPSSK